MVISDAQNYEILNKYKRTCTISQKQESYRKSAQTPG